MRIHRHRNRQPKLNVPQYRVNEQIKSDEARVIDQDDKMLGVLSIKDAISKAREAGFDLVEVSPKANPPVCKFLDYGNFKYQKEKEARIQKRRSKEVEIKGIRLSLRIGKHDLETRAKQADKFLSRGDKVKVELPLRGREKAHKDLAREVVSNFVNELSQKYELRTEQEIKWQGGRLTTIVTKQ